MNFIPDLFVIGAMKAGTTTMHNSILKHPQICLTRTKEVNFFLKDYSLRKLEFLYEKEINNASLIKADVSPAYAKRHLYPQVAERIFNANPTAKIILMTRDPLERIISHLHHNLLRDRFSIKDIEKEVRVNPDYLYTSSYYYQLSQYLEYFPKENILVLLMEDLWKRPEVVIVRLSDFLGVSRITYSNEKSYSSETRFKIKFYDPVHAILGEGKLVKLYHYFWYFVNQRVKKPQLKEETRQSLITELRPDVDQLASFFSLDISPWLNFYTPLLIINK